MRCHAVFLGLAILCASVTAFGDDQRLRRERPFLPPQPREHVVDIAVEQTFAPRTLADGCVTSPIVCNSTSRGRLAVGDCTFSDGTFFDAWRFSGSAGQYVTAMVYPLSSLLTNQTIILAPPTTDASTPPQLWGGKAAAVSYVLSSTGAWALGVGTRDLFASGDYIVALTCEPDPDPSEPQSCVYQDILCGQTGAWFLASQSCRFESDPNRVYAVFTIYGVAGDLLNVELVATAFEPLFAIYDAEQGGAPLATSQSATSTKDTLNYQLPHEGYFDVLVTSNNNQGVGFFTLTVNCLNSGCLPPLLVEQPADRVVPFGSRATLNAFAVAVRGLQYTWFDRSGLPVAIGTGATFITPPVIARQSYSVTARVPCGSVESRLFTVSPAAARRRPVRH